MSVVRGVVRGCVSGVARAVALSQADPLALAIAYYYAKASDGQTITEQRGLGAPNGTNGPTVAVESSDAYYAPYVAADGAYVDFPGTVDNFAFVPDFAAARITGSITIMATATLENWANPSSAVEVCGRYTTASNQRSYRFIITTAGEMQLFWSTNGTTFLAILDTADMSAVFADGTAGTFAVSFIPNDGAGNRIIRFYHSLDYGQSWVLRSDSISATPTSIHAGTSPVYFAQFGTGGQSRLKLHRASIWSGALEASPAKVLDFNAGSFSSGLTYIDPVSGQLVTINQSTTGRPAFVVNETTGSVFQGDAVDKFLNFPSDPAFSVPAGGSLTLIARITAPNTSGFSLIIERGFTNGIRVQSSSTTGFLQIRINDGATTFLNDPIDRRGKSVVIAVVIDNTTIRLDVDGSTVATGAISGGGTAAGALNVLADGVGSGASRSAFSWLCMARDPLTIPQIAAISARLDTLNA